MTVAAVRHHTVALTSLKNCSSLAVTMVMMMLMMTRRRQWELITIITGARWPDVKPRSSLDAVVIVTPATFNYIARHVTRGVATTSHDTSRWAWLLHRTSRHAGRGYDRVDQHVQLHHKLLSTLQPPIAALATTSTLTSFLTLTSPPAALARTSSLASTPLTAASSVLHAPAYSSDPSAASLSSWSALWLGDSGFYRLMQQLQRYAASALNTQRTYQQCSSSASDEQRQITECSPTATPSPAGVAVFL